MKRLVKRLAKWILMFVILMGCYILFNDVGIVLGIGIDYILLDL